MEAYSKKIIYGSSSFFKDPSYQETLKKEFNESATTYYNSSQKIEEISVRSKLNSIIRKILKISCCPRQKSPYQFGSKLVTNPCDWKYKRLIINVDGEKIDAAIMVRPSTAENKKWVITSIGRAQRYEDRLTDNAFQSFLEKTESNAILFNYSKMGGSTGRRNPQTMVAAYKAALEFLEDEKNGIGAKKIIGYGYSIGGGVQGEALKSYNLENGLKKGIQYIFIKDRTFCELKAVIKSYTKGFVKFLPCFDWNLESFESSKKLALLEIPEIIIQTTDEHSNPASDGVISKKASLKTQIITLTQEAKEKKWYIDIKTNGHRNLHAHSMDCFVTPLSEKINVLFKENNSIIKEKFSWHFSLLNFLPLI